MSDTSFKDFIRCYFNYDMLENSHYRENKLNLKKFLCKHNRSQISKRVYVSSFVLTQINIEIFTLLYHGILKVDDTSGTVSLLQI